MRLSDFLGEAKYRVKYSHDGGDGVEEVDATNPVTARSTVYGKLWRGGKRKIDIKSHEEVND